MEKQSVAGLGHHMETTTSAPDDEARRLAENAMIATDEEHRMTFIQAARRFKWAWFWSSVVCLTIIMDGYDTALLGSLQAYPAFQARFGHPVKPGSSDYQLDARWQVALGLSTPIGNLFGVHFNGWATERWGHRKTLIGTLVFLVGVIFIPFFGQRVEILFIGELLCGMAWGVFTTMAPAYASEVCPVVLRSYLENTVVLCWGIGQLISFGMLRALADRTSDPWAWRIPIAVQWFWPLIIIPLMYFAPESPWWLVRKGRVEEAKHVVKRLANDPDDTRAVQSVSLMVQTNNLEKALHEGATIWDCFKGSNLWQTEISCAAWAIQQLSGLVVSGYATYFFQQAGIPKIQSFNMSVGQGGLHLVANVVAFYVTGVVGRRTLFLWGVAGEAFFWFLVGFSSFAPSVSAQGYAGSALYLCWYTVYQLSIGPVVYIIIGETSTTRLRSHTIGLARNAYNFATIINYVIGPYILNPAQGNWKGKCGFLTGGILVLCFLWAFFRLPEMKGRTYEELDTLFARKVPAREFRDAKIDDPASDTEAVKDRIG